VVVSVLSHPQCFGKSIASGNNNNNIIFSFDIQSDIPQDVYKYEYE